MAGPPRMTDGVAARRELQSRAGSDPSPNRIPQCVTESCLLPFPLWRIDLALARTIIEIYGGSIWAESCAEGGAVFRFTLPLVRRSQDAEVLQPNRYS